MEKRKKLMEMIEREIADLPEGLKENVRFNIVVSTIPCFLERSNEEIEKCLEDTLESILLTLRNPRDRMLLHGVIYSNP